MAHHSEYPGCQPLSAMCALMPSLLHVLVFRIATRQTRVSNTSSKLLVPPRFMRCTIISNAKFPYCNNVSCRRDVFGWVAAHKEQIGTEAWSDASAVIQVKYRRWHRSGGGKRVRRREASTDQELKFSVNAGAVPASGSGRVRARE